jgi:hypothetical protein
MTILEKLETLATIENAQAWERTEEKTLFCSDLMESADIRWNEARGEVLEALFESKLYEDSANRAITRAFLEGQHSPSNRWP